MEEKYWWIVKRFTKDSVNAEALYGGKKEMDIYITAMKELYIDDEEFTIIPACYKNKEDMEEDYNIIYKGVRGNIDEKI